MIGNGVNLPIQSVHYGEEPGPSTFQGYSFGDWIPVDVKSSPTTEYGWDGKRGGAPVYTFETFGYAHSGAFERTRDDFDQLVDEVGKPLPNKPAPKVFDAVRSAQLQAYAEGLRTILLEEYRPSPTRQSSSAQLPQRSPPDASVTLPDASVTLPDAGGA